MLLRAITFVSLCLVVIPAAAQMATNASDRQTVIDDQRALGGAYRQLDIDRKENNQAGVQIDQDRIATAEQNFKTDEDRIMTDDEQVLSADRDALDKANLQLQRDQAANSGAVEADMLDIEKVKKKLQTDKQQALDNANQQLEMDLRYNNSSYNGYSNALNSGDVVMGDEDNLKTTSHRLQNAQMKLQMDRGQ